jgi:hypothetical protein
MRAISASVGLRGMNRMDDVRTVQELLNLIPPGEGGPSPKLVVDGIVGLKTNGAIEKLQAKKWGWPRVDTRVDPSGPTWQLLLAYDQAPGPPTAPAPTPAAPAPPEEPKVLGTKFIITVAAKPGGRLDASSFFFMIMDRVNQKQRAVYYFGNIDPPKTPDMFNNSSITNPAVVMTPDPIGVADWGGEAIFSESSANGTIETMMYVLPDALHKRTVRFSLYAHKDEPFTGQGAIRSSFSAPFRLIEIAPGVRQ